MSAETGAPFRGLGVALVTLFDDAGQVDVAATAAHAERLVVRGVQAVLVAGTTGEGFALSLEERSLLVLAIRAAVTAEPGTGTGAAGAGAAPGAGDGLASTAAGGPPAGADRAGDRRIAVVVGTGAPTIELAVARTAAAVADGADAVLALSPPADVDRRAYYEAVAAAAGSVPVLAYHYPAVSPPGIPVDALADLPVVGCKDSSGDADRLRRTAAVWPRALYPGSSALVGLAGELRCAGVILAVANSHPELCVSAFAGDRVAQRDLLTLHLPGVDPITATKRMTAARFGTSSATRAPVA